MGSEQGWRLRFEVGRRVSDEPQRLPSAAVVGVSAVDDELRALPPTAGAAASAEGEPKSGPGFRVRIRIRDR